MSSSSRCCRRRASGNRQQPPAERVRQEGGLEDVGIFACTRIPKRRESRRTLRTRSNENIPYALYSRDRRGIVESGPGFTPPWCVSNVCVVCVVCMCGLVFALCHQCALRRRSLCCVLRRTQHKRTFRIDGALAQYLCYV